ncbi:TadG family pilus assembly protein [Limnohabitans sp. T6-20]|uniref:pilus assembly protein TadG-related protein n=1 Tax=Limnohabitans sp. T6-20 TaxID=1100725 RepID=UPI001304BA7A|nr:TadG family pilus assembly protein [Limnohabitans sp. T6-20]
MKTHTNSEHGAVTLLVALMIPVLLGIAALVIDVAYVQVVRNELQNDADAAALAGAKQLRSSASATPQWSVAERVAFDAIALNAADSKKLSTGTVQSGYWNPTQVNALLQMLPMTPTANDVPAVQVTLIKGNGQNDGEVPTFFARLWNIVSTPVTVTAVAGMTSPGTIEPGGLFPLVASQCIYDTYWNNKATPPGPTLDSKGKPFELVLEAYDDKPKDPCQTFQWSSLLTGNNDVTTFRKLVKERNPVALSIGQKIWIEPGSKTTLYDTVDNCSAANDKTCEYVTLPMVSNIAGHSEQPITSFACARIVDASKKDKTITIQLSTQCPQPPSGGIGPNFGAISPPSLFR